MTEKWDGRFLNLADHIAAWSKDPSTKVGAVIVRADRTVAAMGFNGFPRGVIDSEERYEDRAIKYPMVVHAEMNAVLTASEMLTGMTLYTTLYPCCECTKAIIQAGIARVVTRPIPDSYRERWADSIVHSQTMLMEANVLLSFRP